MRAVTITRLPKAPAIVEGIVNVRGTLVPGLDLRSRFRLEPKPAEHTDHLVLARAGERRVALRVDRVLELRELAAQALDGANTLVRGSEYVAGVAKLDDGLVLVHDLETFLSRAEGETLNLALQGAAAR